MRIGFFDSGIGGITVLKEALKLMPNEDYLYYADTENVPYGTKSKEQVRGFIFEAVDFIVRQGVKALVVACNTATSITINDLRKQYNLPILGMEPAVKPAIKKGDNKRVLVLATPLTLKEERYHNLIYRLESEHIVDSLPMPELVFYAEKFIFDDKIILPYLKERLSQFDMSKYGTIVLGCTHFPFFKYAFKKILPDNIDIIDGSLGTVRHLKNILQSTNNINSVGGGDIVFYTSGKKEEDNSKLIKYLDVLD